MQGFNMGRYVPPDLEGVVSFNAASGKGHALGNRARKLQTERVLIVRFECPFAIWCTTCQPETIIGQGVRFNAEKKKVGNYYSTPMWSFRFKHGQCGGWIEVTTDPKNAEYVVTEGGRRRDLGTDKILEGEMEVGLGPGGRIGGGVTEEEKARFEKDGGFASLEKKVEDKNVFTTQQKRLEELLRASERDWNDPYARSQALRKEFRVGRRKRQADEKSGEALKDKFGLEVDILEENSEDVARVKYIDFGGGKSHMVAAKPMFDGKLVRSNGHDSTVHQNVGRGRDKKTLKGEKMENHKLEVQNNLQTNTRIATDPFLGQEEAWQSRAKRKKVERRPSNKEEEVRPTQQLGLVDYDSDSS